MTRFLDYLFVLSAFSLFLLPGLVIIVLIRRGSPGPAIFCQERVGQHGQIFTCYKFRTMKIGTDNVPTHEVGVDRTTSIGRFLRRTKLDELPQAVNILRGEMSLVGPRPCLPSQVDLIKARKDREVLSVLPGITGLAQINNVDMSRPRRLARWDQIFIRRRSLKLYVQIVVATFLRQGAGDRIKNDPA